MRKRRAVKRDVLPDALYKSKVVTKLINNIMLDGKKGTAQKILYEAFEIVEKQTGKDAMDVYAEATKDLKRSEMINFDEYFNNQKGIQYGIN